jgi:flagellar protein FliL
MKMADQGDKGSRGLVTILLGVMAVLLVGSLLLSGLIFMKLGAMAQPKEAKVIEQKPEPGKIYDLGTFIVNLADEDASRYVRAQVQLEYSQVNVDLDKEIKERDAQFKDLVNTLLNDRRAAELSTSEGKERFRRELQLHINEILKYGAVNNVYLTTFAIQ